MLKLKFDSKQEYQKTAIDSIVDVFKWQPYKNSKFTIARTSRAQQITNQHGISNKLELDNEDLLENVINIQDKNNLPRTKTIIDDNYKVPNYTIEMETGTWKTYVYTRTILELYKKYGLSKYIIVVPSVAIREWVFKSLEITEDHFSEIYDWVKCNFFKYDSSKPTQARDYAESDTIEIMIINIDAFRKWVEDEAKWKETKSNLIFRESDKLQWNRPIDFITQTNPIIIIDEPQSVDNTEKSKIAVNKLNPLFILRYSATHKEKYNLLYRLWPVEAYEEKLVKKIEVLPITSEWDNNSPYLKLISVDCKKGYKAKVEMNVNADWKTTRRILQVDANWKNDLYLLSWRLEAYKNYIIEWINCFEWNEELDFESWKTLKLNEVWGEINDLEIKRVQIRWTITSHLDKERNFLSKWIKVISLFFLDKVENYKIYHEDWTTTKWVYASIFEEEYQKIIKQPRYNSLLTSDKFKDLLGVDISKVHDWYFAKDKKGKLKNSSERWNADDESAYELIMKKKEELLWFETPLRFIFSHSALREWWDNPNVFQICTLVESVDPFTKRQKIGRWLRLPVNQDWDRIKDDDINILTVVANESYEDFAETLQKEMEAETGVRFGYIEPQLFSHILETNPNTKEKEEIWYKKSESIHKHLQDQWYIDRNGKVKQKLKEDIVSESFELPTEYEEVAGEVVTHIKDAIKKLPVFNQKERIDIKVNKEVLLSPEFKDLWDRIKYKTYYKIDFNIDEFIDECTIWVQKMEAIELTKIKMQWVRLNIEKKWVTTSESYRNRSYDLKWYDDNLPDLIRMIEENTWLKRNTIIHILLESKRLIDFTNNPHKFIEKVSYIINDTKRKRIVDWIKYEKVWDAYYYTMKKFEDKELTSNFKSNTIPVTKSIYTYTVYDSIVEKTFAEKMNNNEDIKLFVKLPDWFKIDTPLWKYNPDWAILYEKNWVEKLYFVIETKWSSKELQLKMAESEKIICAKKHFECLWDEINYEVVSDFEEFEMKA